MSVDQGRPDLCAYIAHIRAVEHASYVLQVAGEAGDWVQPDHALFRLSLMHVEDHLLRRHKSIGRGMLQTVLAHASPDDLATALHKHRMLPPAELEQPQLAAVVEANPRYRLWLRFRSAGRVILTRSHSAPQVRARRLNRLSIRSFISRHQYTPDAIAHLVNSMNETHQALRPSTHWAIGNAIRALGYGTIMQQPTTAPSASLAAHRFCMSKALSWAAVRDGLGGLRLEHLFDHLKIIDQLHQRPSEEFLATSRLSNAASNSCDAPVLSHVLQWAVSERYSLYCALDRGVHVQLEPTLDAPLVRQARVEPLIPPLPFDLSRAMPIPARGTHAVSVAISPAAMYLVFMIGRPSLLPEVNFLHSWCLASQRERSKTHRRWTSVVRHTDASQTLPRIAADVQAAVAKFLSDVGSRNFSSMPPKVEQEMAASRLNSFFFGGVGQYRDLAKRLPAEIPRGVIELLLRICCVSSGGIPRSRPDPQVASTQPLVTLLAQPAPRASARAGR